MEEGNCSIPSAVLKLTSAYVLRVHETQTMAVLLKKNQADCEDNTEYETVLYPCFDYKQTKNY